MCGIAGYFHYFPQSPPDSCEVLQKALQHRGPDAQGAFYDADKGTALIHTRLSIIDPDSRSNQPFYSSCGRYVMVFNGEIYNYRELKAQLADISFITSSDTEVLLALYIKYGADCLSKLNGMFAFAVFDRQENTLFIARDRLGKKPLFYSEYNGAFIFASEIKAIRSLLYDVPWQKDTEALQWYLHLGYIPEPFTGFKQVKKFPSGSYAIIQPGKPIDIQSYWKVPPTLPYTFHREADVLEELQQLLINSVSIRLESDVPFGAFLSGGTDSSLIAALASRQLPSPLHTFSIGFDDPKYNEAEHAANIAQYLGTKHTRFTVTEKELQALLPSIIEVFDEPFADSSAIPTQMVSKLASEQVKMVLTGDGGDELFLGYGMYTWARRLSNPFWWNTRKGIAAVLKMGDEHKQRAADVFKVPDKNHLYNHIFSQEQYLFSQREVSSLFGTIVPFNSFSFKYLENIDPELNQSFHDICFYLKDDLLVKVDRSTMRFGVEARSPLLDYRVLEFARSLPTGILLKGGVQKYILKQVLYKYIPKETMERPKWGFSVPLGKWLRNDWRMYRDTYIEPLLKSGYLDAGVVSKYIKAFEGGKDYYYNRVWALIVLQQFLQKNG